MTSIVYIFQKILKISVDKTGNCEPLTISIGPEKSVLRIDLLSDSDITRMKFNSKVSKLYIFSLENDGKWELKFFSIVSSLFC